MELNMDILSFRKAILAVTFDLWQNGEFYCISAYCILFLEYKNIIIELNFIVLS